VYSILANYFFIYKKLTSHDNCEKPNNTPLH
jgi:hypothetical protein